MRRSHARNRVDSNTNDQNKMDPATKLHTRHISTRSTKLKHTKSKLAIVLISMGLLSCYYLFKSEKPSFSKKYGIIIDGGSTGTRIHVFGYPVESGEKVILDFEGAMKVNPGLSAYVEYPEGAGGSIEELVEFGKGRVPMELWGETEIRLMATAGMRLLDLEVQDRILSACRRVLRKSGFKFQDSWASVIPGSDEGLYAWVIANYALGTLGGDPLETTGIVELGGASAQIAFVTLEPVPPEFSRMVKFRNITYNIYTHSFLHFGLNAALEALKESLVSIDHPSTAESLGKGVVIDPCSPKGYSHVAESWKLSPGSMTGKNQFLSTLHSRGNFSECRSATLKLLQKGKDRCNFQQCHVGSVFVPKLQGKFLATENFFYTSKFFGLGQRAYLADLMKAGECFCEEDWSVLKKKHQSFEDDDLVHYCFSSAYIIALLHDSLGIAVDDQRIGFANQVGDIPLDWALGAFILHTDAVLDMKHPDWIATVICDDSPTLLYIIGVAILLLFIAWCISKWKKPQLKTIYDLEKGRYIVTHVGKS